MARSLTVKHEEKSGVSPLLLAFLLFACSWLALSGLAGAVAATGESPAPIGWNSVD